MIVKVCGMTSAENIKAVEAVLADTKATEKWMGFIFWEPSKRNCAVKPDYLPADCRRVGVFVNAEVEDVVKHAVEYGLSVIQLHGDENRMYIMALRQALAAANNKCTIVKALSLKEAKDIEKCEPYVGFVDYFLFDTPTTGRGGSGTSFDWKLLDNYRMMTPFLLSGGIGLDSVESLKQFNHPCWEGIDLNSKFESAPGIKDAKKLREFLISIN